VLLFENASALKNHQSASKYMVIIVSYTRNWVCDIALIGCTLSLGKTQEGSGFQREGYKGTMGDKGSQFTSNLGLRRTIPVTAGGSQVSKREYSKGKYAVYIYS
jgi:hypothetical protein